MQKDGKNGNIFNRKIKKTAIFLQRKLSEIN